MEIHIVIDDRIAAAFGLLRRLVTRRRLSFATLVLTLASALWATAAPLTNLHTFVAGKPASAAEVNENFAALFAAFNDHIIREDQTVTISEAQGCDGLIAAIGEVQEHHILPGATVTIVLATGKYACSKAIAIRRTEGGFLIVGGGAVPSAVTLSFPASMNGIVVARGAVLSSVRNLVLQGGHTATGVGVLAFAGGVVDIQNVEISGFGAGISAEALGVVSGSAVTTTMVREYAQGVATLTSPTPRPHGTTGRAFKPTTAASCCCIRPPRRATPHTICPLSPAVHSATSTARLWTTAQQTSSSRSESPTRRVRSSSEVRELE